MKYDMNSLSFKEKRKFQVILNVIEGKFTIERAAVVLGYNKYYIKKLVTEYMNFGVECLIHKSKGLPSNRRANLELKSLIIDLYKKNYLGFNFTHFREKLLKNHNIQIPYTTCKNYLNSSGIFSPRSHRIKSKKDIHSLRPRRELFGELIQMDASIHLWFGDDKTHLHAAIDDATGIIVGAHFSKQETLKSYYIVLRQIIAKYGVPWELYTDNKTVFNYNSSKNANHDKPTNFRFACNRLGIDIITTSVPQAKGRIERLFGTLQDRLINEMRLANIQTIDEANMFLPGFINDFNLKFALPLNDNINGFEKLDNLKVLDYILVKFYPRKVNKGSSIKFFNKQYLAFNNASKQQLLNPGANVLVPQNFKDELFLLDDENILHYLVELTPEEIEIRTINQRSPLIKKVKPKRYHIPTFTHPWREYPVKDIITFLDYHPEDFQEYIQ
ncbi:MAG TPA: ISNCY family transposase [Mollicutes bacterium]|nr:ISNCY family transposase [Mollicutes bacterium]